jgi:hypothetical protein
MGSSMEVEGDRNKRMAANGRGVGEGNEMAINRLLFPFETELYADGQRMPNPPNWAQTLKQRIPVSPF